MFHISTRRLWYFINRGPVMPKLSVLFLLLSARKGLKRSQALNYALSIEILITASRSVRIRSFPAGPQLDLFFSVRARWTFLIVLSLLRHVQRASQGGVPELYPFILRAPPDFGGVETTLLLW